MPKLNKSYCLETDEFFNTTEKNNEKINKGILRTVFFDNNSALGTTNPTPSTLEMSHKNNLL